MSRERRVENEEFFRRVNEGIDTVAEEVFDESSGAPQVWRFVCECSSRDCTETIALTVAEFEAIRDTDATYVIVPGHVDHEIEHVVDANGSRYWLVEKEL